MARFYSDENVPLDVVRGLRSLGHDVLTAFEAGQANRNTQDDEVLRFAVEEKRAVLTLNRLDFHRLHRVTRTFPKTSRGGAGSWRVGWPGARRERCLCAS